jgi:predicted metal-dependent peptidase
MSSGTSKTTELPGLLATAERRRIHTLRMQMVEAHPFWGHLFLQVRLVPAPGLPAFAATDCVRHVWYNPAWTRHLDHAQLGFVLAHEVGHQLLASAQREGGRDRHLWNCATDYAINRLVDRIQTSGYGNRPLYRLPDGRYSEIGHVKVLLDRRFDNMVAEAIYDVLAAESLPEPRLVAASLPVTRTDGDVTTVQVPNVSDHGGGIDVHLPDGTLSEDDRDELAARLKAALAAWQKASHQGNCPADLVRIVEESRQSRIPWRRVLGTFTGQALTRDDWTLARPNLRFLEQGILVPGPWSERAGHIVISVDSSGSMSAETLEAVAGEMKALVEQAEDVTIIVSDSKVQQVVEGRDVGGFLRQIRLKGGGGTDHRPVFELLDERNIVPDLFVGLTDLYTTLPDEKPRFPVIWVVPKRHGAATWGKVVEVE